MSDQQASSPQVAAPANQPQAGSQSSPDSSAQSQEGQGLPQRDDSAARKAGGYSDEVTEALEAVGADGDSDSSGAEASGADDSATGETEAPSREPAEQQSESDSKGSETSASDPTDKVKPSALATFHRQQKELFHAQQEFKAKQAEYDRHMAILENAKSDRLAALELMGFTDTKEFLRSIAEDGGRETPERKQLRELQKWKETQEKERQTQAEQFQAQQQQQAVQAKLDAIKSQVQDTLKSEAHRDGLLAMAGSDDNVMAEMDRMATETGEMPRIEDAVTAVKAKYESYLKEMATNKEVVKFFEGVIQKSREQMSGTPQSKTRAKTATIGAEARGPGTRIPKAHEAPDEDETMAEALRFLSSAQG